MTIIKFLFLMFFLLTYSQANEKACMEGNASACYAYALPLVIGENAEVQDIREKGLSYIRKSCILGYDKACEVLGENYYKDKSYIAARPYLKQSWERDVKRDCEAVAVIYRDGHDVKHDDTQARIFFEKACELSSGDACYNVAIIYRGGFGVTRSRTVEKTFYQKSCEAGLKAGCARYTELDNEDKGIETGVWADIKALFS